MKKTLLTILPLLLIVGCSKKPEGVYNEEGEKDGKWTTWYEPANWYSSDSEKKSEGVYDNGEKVGEWTYWYENGNKKEVTNLDKNGNLIKEERMSDCGNVTIYYNTDGSVDHTTESPDREKFRKEARQFAYDRLRISGSGINFYSSNSPFFCRYKFTGSMFDRYNNPHFFSISVNYNGYSWNVVNVDIQ